jgi:hypothetical protein
VEDILAQLARKFVPQDVRCRVFRRSLGCWPPFSALYQGATMVLRYPQTGEFHEWYVMILTQNACLTYTCRVGQHTGHRVTRCSADEDI